MLGCDSDLSFLVGILARIVGPCCWLHSVYPRSALNSSKAVSDLETGPLRTAWMHSPVSPHPASHQSACCLHSQDVLWLIPPIHASLIWYQAMGLFLPGVGQKGTSPWWCLHPSGTFLVLLLADTCTCLVLRQPRTRAVRCCGNSHHQ